LDPANGYLYVADNTSSTVGVVNTTTSSVVTSIHVGKAPYDIAYDSLTGNLFVTNSATNNVSVIDGLTNKVVANLGYVGIRPTGVVYDNQSNEIYVANELSGNVTVLNASSYAVVASLVTGYDPFSLLFDSKDYGIYVLFAEQFQIDVFNGSSHALEYGSTIGLTYNPAAAAIDPANNDLYVTFTGHADYQFVSIGPGGGNGLFPLPFPGQGAAYDPATGFMLIANGDAISMLEPILVKNTVTIDTGATSVVFDPLNNALYTSDTASNMVSVIYFAPESTQLNGMTESPGDISVMPGGSVIVSATAACNGVPCLGKVTFSWSLTNGLGTLNSSSSPDVNFTAGGTTGTDWLYVNASLNGTTIGTHVSITVTSIVPHYTLTFVVSPTVCGPITFNNSAQASGSNGSYQQGFYSAIAPACPHYSFRQWNGTFGVSLAAPRNSSSSVKITENGSLTAWYVWVPTVIPHWKVSFSISPAVCGPIAFAGTAQTNGSSGLYVKGNYSATANPCNSYAFQQWNFTGGVAVNRSSTSSSTIVTVFGNGTLTAWYVWSGKGGSHATVDFAISPTRCGPINFGGFNETNSAFGNFATGNYTAIAANCPGTSYAVWSVSGALTLPKLGSNPTTVGVWGNGTLTATYQLISPPAYYTVTFYISPSVCSPVSFNGTTQANDSSAQFLNGVYTMQARACTGYTFAQGTFQMPDGRSQILSSPYGNVSVSTNGTMWVNYTAKPPTPPTHYTANFVVDPATCGPIMFNGTYQANQSSGLFLSGNYPAEAISCSGYAFAAWSSTGSLAISGNSSMSISVTVTGNGTLAATYRAIVIERPGPLEAFGNATITGYPGSCNSGKVPAMNVSFTGAARGGRPPYSYSWNFGDGSATANGQNSTHGYALIENESVTLTVTDSSGNHTARAVPVIVPYPLIFMCPGSPPHSTGFSIFGLSTEMSIAVIAVIAAVAVLAAVTVILLHRRKSGGEPAPPPKVKE
jgi:YVTN family beta-propeller protein